MATVMLMEWPGISKSQYEQVMAMLDLDKNRPAGAIFHVAGFTPEGLRVLDIWESQQAFEQFQKDRLVQAVQKAGAPGQPNVQFFPVHNIFVNDMAKLQAAGASSLPSAM